MSSSPTIFSNGYILNLSDQGAHPYIEILPPPELVNGIMTLKNRHLSYLVSKHLAPNEDAHITLFYLQDVTMNDAKELYPHFLSAFAPIIEKLSSDIDMMFRDGWVVRL